MGVYPIVLFKISSPLFLSPASFSHFPGIMDDFSRPLYWKRTPGPWTGHCCKARQKTKLPPPSFLSLPLRFENLSTSHSLRLPSLSLSSSPSARSIPLAPFPSSLLSRGSRLDNFLVIRWALVKTEESSLHVVSSVASFVSPRKIRSPKSRRERDRHRVEAWRFGRIRTGEILDLDKSNGRLAFRKLIAPCGSPSLLSPFLAILPPLPLELLLLHGWFLLLRGKSLSLSLSDGEWREWREDFWWSMSCFGGNESETVEISTLEVAFHSLF